MQTLHRRAALFLEGVKGTLEPGKLADIAIIDRDIRRVASEAIRDARVTATILGGEIVYQAAGPDDPSSDDRHARGNGWLWRGAARPSYHVGPSSRTTSRKPTDER